VAIRDGKTSSELIRRKSYAEELAELEASAGEGESAGKQEDGESHVEYAVMDQYGRLQIPSGHLESVGLKGAKKVRVALEDGRIVLLPPE
jgi:hypothetical protein